MTAVPGTFRPADRDVVDVLMDDGSWGHAEVLGWARDESGAWRVLLLW